ncbi:MAG TPA: BtpA/SgcQ family protein [Acidimicrobiia bacterium]
MIHLLPLPGSPRFNGSMSEVLETAISDASTMREAGFPALLVENFGDAPFRADQVDPETVAGVTLAVEAVMQATGVPVGVNILRNDAISALGIATVTGALFIRVNVLTGVMNTDQGPIVGRAAELLRKRRELGLGVEIWADVMVKHATPPPGLEPGQAALDTVERGLADAVIVSGPGTGAEPDIEVAREIRSVIPKGSRVVIGSGASTGNLSRLVEVADTVIVGSGIKIDNDANNRVDEAKVAAFIEAAANAGLL